MFNPGLPSGMRPVGYDAPYQYTADLRWFEGVLRLSGYRPYRLTPDNGLSPIIVWAQPVVAIKGWSKRATTERDKWRGVHVDSMDEPVIEYGVPDLSRFIAGRVEAAPGASLRADAIILVADDDGGYINFVGKIIYDRELLPSS